jgi:hypothetical protein
VKSSAGKELSLCRALLLPVAWLLVVAIVALHTCHHLPSLALVDVSMWEFLSIHGGLVNVPFAQVEMASIAPKASRERRAHSCAHTNTHKIHTCRDITAKICYNSVVPIAVRLKKLGQFGGGKG